MLYFSVFVFSIGRAFHQQDQDFFAPLSDGFPVPYLPKILRGPELEFTWQGADTLKLFSPSLCIITIQGSRKNSTSSLLRSASKYACWSKSLFSIQIMPAKKHLRVGFKMTFCG